MVVKFHWLTGGVASLAAICGAHYSHGGWQGMKTPTEKKKKKPNTKDVATGEEAKRLRDLQLRLFQQ